MLGHKLGLVWLIFRSKYSLYFLPVLILLLAFVSYIPFLGSYGLLDPTDSFFLESGREMLEQKQFLLPMNNYQIWLDKPILYFWLVSAFYKTFGISPFVGRLPAAISAIICSLIIYFGSRPMLSKRAAVIASVIFMANPLSSIIGHVCLTDMTLTMLLTGALLFLSKSIFCVYYTNSIVTNAKSVSGVKSNVSDLILGYLFLALAVLCKGPIALILVALIFVIYFVSVSSSAKTFFQNIFALKPLIGFGIILLLNLPWYWAASIASQGKFLYAFFVEQNFGRMMGTVNHQGPFWFYLPVIFGGLAPWWLFVLVFPRRVRNVFTNVKDKLLPNSPIKLFTRFIFIWLIVVLLLFSAIKTKLPTYILPAVPAFSIISAACIEILTRKKYFKIFSRIIFAIIFTMVGAIFASYFLRGYLRGIIFDSLWILIFLCPGLILLIRSLLIKNSWQAISFLCFTIVLCCSLITPSGLRAFYKARQIGFSNLVLQAQKAGASIAMISAEEPSVPWITHKPVSRLMTDIDARDYLSKLPAPHYVLIPKEMLPRLDWFGGKQSLCASSGKWYLYEIRSLEIK